MNVRTLRKTTKRQEIAELASKFQISILGLIDHKIVHDDDETKIEKYGEYTMITTSAWRNKNNASSGGIGLLLNKTSLILKLILTVGLILRGLIIKFFCGLKLTQWLTHERVKLTYNNSQME